MDILKLLQSFSAISLEEMDHVKLMDRVDTKFAFSASKLPEILSALSQEYRILTIKNKPFAAYQSVYFDNPDFEFFHDHHRSKMSRFKIRKRKYIDSDLTFLEVKHKFKGRTIKSRIKIDGYANELSNLDKEFLNSVSPNYDNLNPCLENFFERITLVGINFSERLTLDLNVKFKWESKETSLENVVIAELKQSKTDRTSPFFAEMRNHELRPYRLSKYCMGAMQIHDHADLKSNRFKKKLLTINKINNNA